MLGPGLIGMELSDSGMICMKLGHKESLNKKKRVSIIVLYLI